MFFSLHIFGNISLFEFYTSIYLLLRSVFLHFYYNYSLNLFFFLSKDINIIEYHYLKFTKPRFLKKWQKPKLNHKKTLFAWSARKNLVTLAQLAQSGHAPSNAAINTKKCSTLRRESSGLSMVALLQCKKGGQTCVCWNLLFGCQSHAVSICG